MTWSFDAVISPPGSNTRQQIRPRQEKLWHQCEPPASTNLLRVLRSSGPWNVFKVNFGSAFAQARANSSCYVVLDWTLWNTSSASAKSINRNNRTKNSLWSAAKAAVIRKAERILRKHETLKNHEQLKRCRLKTTFPIALLPDMMHQVFPSGAENSRTRHDWAWPLKRYLYICLWNCETGGFLSSVWSTYYVERQTPDQWVS